MGAFFGHLLFEEVLPSCISDADWSVFLKHKIKLSCEGMFFFSEICLMSQLIQRFWGFVSHPVSRSCVTLMCLQCAAG